jgi:hypothetical protein
MGFTMIPNEPRKKVAMLRYNRFYVPLFEKIIRGDPLDFFKKMKKKFFLGNCLFLSRIMKND